MDDIWKFLGVVIPATFAIAGWWRRQLIGKRRFELAEEALTVFMTAKQALDYIRSPMSMSHEWEDRKPAEHETENEKRNRDTYYVPFGRAEKVADKFVPLRKTQLLCRYHFGEKAYQAFETLWRARHRTLVSARMLNMQIGELERFDPGTVPYQNLVKQRRAWEEDIWQTEGDEDKIFADVKQAQADLEAICVPYLRAHSTYWGAVIELAKSSVRTLANVLEPVTRWFIGMFR